MTSESASTLTGAELRDLRRRAGLSRQALGDLAACSVASVAAFELGARPASSPTLERVVRVLVTLNEQRPGRRPTVAKRDVPAPHRSA